MIYIKNKSKINLVIDGVMLILLALIIGGGLMIKYVLLPGFKRNVLYGSDAELYFWGLDRHQWGSIHLYLGFVFLFLLFLHVILHWKMIVGIFSQMIKGQISRKIISVCIGGVALFFALAPLLLRPEVMPLERKYNHRQNTENFIREMQPMLPTQPSAQAFQRTAEKSNEEQKRSHLIHDFSKLEIFGSMTLEEVSQKYSIPLNRLAGTLNIPLNKSGERIGRLKRRYGFEIIELKETITQLKE
ncbi:DUF4405 domain-containing protein [Maribellus comscasis]|uniref:DUF4405 domain-containing protein n=1 Tax=Maribellus comscasis TaxID=2681766 RepID=A0A6I6JWY3_9BACT|nr:DUF4405 domain-containing protein [Maribellus comscasis]QGY47646.1 DUF4405 domain-containing protein [Maribellus comscasis]